jgi:hypothetical protein
MHHTKISIGPSQDWTIYLGRSPDNTVDLDEGEWLP